MGHIVRGQPIIPAGQQACLTPDKCERKTSHVKVSSQKQLGQVAKGHLDVNRQHRSECVCCAFLSNEAANG